MQGAVDKLLGIYDEENKYIFRAARSENNSAPAIKSRDENSINRLKNAPRVVSEEEL